MGEAMVVIGLGLLGQLTVQLLKANGCRVFGVDLDPTKVELAKKLGADDAMVSDDRVKPAIRDWTRGRGADAVLITAATMSNELVQLAGETPFRRTQAGILFKRDLTRLQTSGSAGSSGTTKKSARTRSNQGFSATSRTTQRSQMLARAATTR